MTKVQYQLYWICMVTTCRLLESTVVMLTKLWYDQSKVDFDWCCISCYYREYPCDHVAMLNLAVLNVGSPRTQTHETAVHLLHLLDIRFFQETPVFTDSADEQRQQNLPLNDILISVSYNHSQLYLSDQLARVQPDLTMPMFSGETTFSVTLEVRPKHRSIYLYLEMGQNLKHLS